MRLQEVDCESDSKLLDDGTTRCDAQVVAQILEHPAWQRGHLYDPVPPTATGGSFKAVEYLPQTAVGVAPSLHTASC